MKINEILNELFDPSSGFDIEYKADGTALYASATDRQGRVLDISIIPGEVPDSVDIEFKRGGTHELTGNGDAERVFATVLTVIKYYLSDIDKPKYIFFHAKEPSRIRLYKALVRRMARSFGYEEIDVYTNPPEEIEDYLIYTDGIFLLQRKD